MVFAVALLLYYWFTGDEIWYGASIGCHKPDMRAGAIERARCALTARQRPQPPTLWGSPRAPVGAAGECWHCRRVQQFIRFVLGALPIFIGWVLAEGQQHPTTSHGVSSQFGATGAKSCMMASAASRRGMGVANVLAGLTAQTKGWTPVL